jgi:hypothetical protein
VSICLVKESRYDSCHAIKDRKQITTAKAFEKILNNIG